MLTQNKSFILSYQWSSRNKLNQGADCLLLTACSIELARQHHKKANSTMAFLYRNIRPSPPQAKATAYKTYVHPTIEFSSSGLSLYYANNISQLEIIQRRAATIVKNYYIRTSSVATMLHNLSWNTRADWRDKIIYAVPIGGGRGLYVQHFTWCMNKKHLYKCYILRAGRGSYVDRENIRKIGSNQAKIAVYNRILHLLRWNRT